MKNFKTAISYATIIFLLVLYTLFLDGKTGVIMIAFFIVIPMISFTLTIISLRNISAELICEHDNMKKNTSGRYSVKIRKNNFLPAPFLSIGISSSPHFKIEEGNFMRVAIPLKKELSISGEITAYISGNAFISIENAYISDYLNIFAFKLKNISDIHTINIVPQIHELNSAGTVFRTVSDSMLIDENEEESTNDFSNNIASVAGYEHREYKAGDPIKRINWKLSSKKNKLMIRLDESMPSVRPSVILNLSQCNSCSEECLLKKEILVEGCLSFMEFCIRQGIECKFFFYENNSWHFMNVSSSDDVGLIALKIPKLPEICNGQYLPDDAMIKMKSAGTYVLFIEKFCTELSEDIELSNQNGTEVLTITTDRNVTSEKIWHIDKNMEITESGGIKK